jgi:hypothetical protein
MAEQLIKQWLAKEIQDQLSAQVETMQDVKLGKFLGEGLDEYMSSGSSFVSALQHVLNHVTTDGWPVAMIGVVAQQDGTVPGTHWIQDEIENHLRKQQESIRALKTGEAWTLHLLDYIDSENSFISGLTFVLRKVKDEGWDQPLQQVAAKADEFVVLAEQDIDRTDLGRSR